MTRNGPLLMAALACVALGLWGTPAQAQEVRVPAHVRLADDARLVLEKIDEQVVALSKQRYQPSQFWPALGAVAGFSVGTGFSATGTAMLVWSAQDDANRPRELDESGDGGQRVFGAMFVAAGAVSLLVGSLCVWKIRKNKRIRAEREEEIERLMRKRREFELELRAVTSGP